LNKESFKNTLLVQDHIIKSGKDFRNFGFDFVSSGLDMKKLYRYFVCFNELKLHFNRLILLTGKINNLIVV